MTLILPRPLWPKMVLTVRFPPIDQIELFNHLTVCKQINSGLFKMLPINYLSTNPIYLLLYKQALALHNGWYAIKSQPTRAGFSHILSISTPYSRSYSILTCITIIIILCTIIIIILLIWEFSTTALDDDFPLESEWQQVSLSHQDSP